MDRIAVIGTSCSGKTTLARTIANTLNITHVELDALFWQPNWQSLPGDEFRSVTQKAVSAKRWVVDGNYSLVRIIIWTRADTVIWLNYPFHIVFFRALRRTLKRIISKEELFSGCRETFRQSFLSPDSILWWVSKTYRRRRREYPQLFQRPEYTHLQVVELRSPGQAEGFVRGLRD